MIRRKRIIGFRLTLAEEEQFLPLLGLHGRHNWSDLVRRALAEMLERHSQLTSNNGSKPRLTVGRAMFLFDRKTAAAKAKKRVKPSSR